MKRLPLLIVTALMLVVAPAAAAKHKPKPHHAKPSPSKAALAAQAKQKQQDAFRAYIAATNPLQTEFANAKAVIDSGLPRFSSTPDNTWAQTATLVQSQLTAMDDARNKLAQVKVPTELRTAHEGYVQALTVFEVWVEQLETALNDRSLPELQAWSSQVQSVETRIRSLEQAWQTAVIADGKQLGIKVIVSTGP